MFIEFRCIINKLILFYIIFISIHIIKCKRVGKKKKTNEIQSFVNVSIIIPAYNTGKYIERCIKNSLNQTLKEIEVIVIDDNSNDNTLEVVKKFENDKRLKIITLSKNVGPGIARNIGIEMAVGEFLTFFDSDDYADVRFLEYLYKYSKNNDLVGGIYVDSTNLSNKFTHHGKKKKKYHGGTCDSIWRREFINKNFIRYPNRRKAEDVQFRIDFMEAKPRVFIAPDEGIYYYYKRRQGSLMNFTAKYIEKLNKRCNEIIK